MPSLETDTDRRIKLLTNGFRVWLEKEGFAFSTIHHYCSCTGMVLRRCESVWDAEQLRQLARETSPGRLAIMGAAWSRFGEYLRATYPNEAVYPPPFPMNATGEPPKMGRPKRDAPKPVPLRRTSESGGPLPLPDSVLDAVWRLRAQGIKPGRLLDLRWESVSYFELPWSPDALTALIAWAWGPEGEDRVKVLASPRPVIPVRTGAAVAYPRPAFLEQFSAWEARDTTAPT